jgi:hypothetical protein
VFVRATRWPLSSFGRRRSGADAKTVVAVTDETVTLRSCCPSRTPETTVPSPILASITQAVRRQGSPPRRCRSLVACVGDQPRLEYYEDQDGDGTRNGRDLYPEVPGLLLARQATRTVAPRAKRHSATGDVGRALGAGASGWSYPAASEALRLTMTSRKAPTMPCRGSVMA